MSKCKCCHGTGVSPDWKRLGKELRERRVMSGIALRKVAREADVSAAHLSDMELGRRSMAGPKAVRVLAMFDLDVRHAFTLPFEVWEPTEGET